MAAYSFSISPKHLHTLARISTPHDLSAQVKSGPTLLKLYQKTNRPEDGETRLLGLQATFEPV